MLDEQHQSHANQQRNGARVETTERTDIEDTHTPISLSDAVFHGLRNLHEDESTGIVPQDVIDCLSDSMLGTTVAPGVLLSYAKGIPQIHLFDTKLDTTTKDYQKTQDTIIELIADKGGLQATTPSHNAVRVMMIMMRKFPGLTKEDGKALHALRKEMDTIDLLSPENPHWEQRLRMNIDGNRVSVRFRLEKQTRITRAMTVFLGSDIPQEQRNNKYGYKIDFELAEPHKTEALYTLQNRIASLKTVALTVTPMAAVTWGMINFLPTQLLPTFTSNQAIQSLAELTVDFSPIAATGVLTSYLLSKAKRAKHT